MVTVKPDKLPVKLIVRLGSTAVAVLFVTANGFTSIVIPGAVAPVGAGFTITALVLV